MTMFPIAAVARDTGLNKDTLRVWERRYGFPRPGRDEHGERSYSADEVEQLRVVRRLIDAGHRPGRLLAMSAEQRLVLADRAGPPSDTPTADAGQASAGVAATLDHYLTLARAMDAAALRRQLGRDATRMGLMPFLVELLAPASAAVGEAWMRGELEVFEEHVFTACAETTLQHALAGLPDPARDVRPRVLLATLPGEPHALGLRMAELALALHGAQCVSLGVQVPVVDLARAAAAADADIVALSVTGCANSRNAQRDLSELRSRLGVDAELWVGGRAAGLRRQTLDGLTWIDRLETLPDALARWRERAAAD